MRLLFGRKIFMANITVAFATPEKQLEIKLSVAENSTVAAAIALSKIREKFPEINVSHYVVGIFGKRATLETCVRDGDRVEIYRPLFIDPKAARRKKAAD